MSRSAKPSTPSAGGAVLTARSGATFVKNYGMLLFFVLLLVLNAFITPNFLSVGTLDKTLRQVFPIMLVALGMTLVISSGGIDISVGAIMAVSAAVTARLYDPEGSVFLPLCCGALAAALCGLLNGVLIARFKIQPIVMTLVVMFAGRGLAQMIQGEAPISLMFTPFEDFGRYRIAGVPVQVAIMLVAVVAMLLIVKKTVFAKQVEAIGDNSTAARLVGVRMFSVTVGVYVLCSILCAIAGNMEAARVGSVDGGKLGRFIELDAIAAVAIGGTSFAGGRARVLGTVFGAIVVQLVTVIVNMNDIQDHYSLILKAFVLVVAVWAQREK